MGTFSNGARHAWKRQAPKRDPITTMLRHAATLTGMTPHRFHRSGNRSMFGYAYYRKMHIIEKAKRMGRWYQRHRLTPF
jgi:hypothetical protein